MSVINTSTTLTQTLLNGYTWPVTINGGTSGSPVIVTLGENVTITGATRYFIMGSEYITFDGNNNTVTISGVTGYPGLIRNGTFPVNGRAIVTVQNVGVSSSSSTLAVDGGWVCQSYFSRGVNNNIVRNCYSSGAISQGSGGICGAQAGRNSGGSVTITSCYSIGAMSAASSGGICGAQAASTGGTVTITSCYSLGVIGGTNSGGICGLQAASTGGTVTITACYSLGAISGLQTGGICGYQAGISGTVTINNCYSYGNFTSLTNTYIPGIVGAGSITPGITNYYAARGTWSDTSANTIGIDANGQATGLTGTPTGLYVSNPGANWTTLATNTPYVLSSYNAQLYSPNSAINPSGTYTYTSSPGLLIGKTYSILSVNNAAKPSSINIVSGTGALSFNFSSDTDAIFNVKVFASNGTAPNYYGYNVNSFTFNQLCFKEGSKILCLNPETNSEEYIKIEDLRKGDLVKTFLHGYKPISNIGYSTMFNKVDEERTKDKLYKCEQTEYPEVFEPLVITGGHSILVDYLKDETAWNKTCEVCNGDVYMTDGKYRLPACVDDRAKIYEIEGTHKIYHFALEHDDYYMNYGIYANGLLVETTSNRMIEKYGMTLIE